MKRFVASLAAAAALAGATAIVTDTASAAPSDCNGKTLNSRGTGYGASDITGGDTDFVPATRDGVAGYEITLTISLAAPSCSAVGYTATMYTPGTSPLAVIDSSPGTADGFDTVIFPAIFASEAQVVHPSSSTTCVLVDATTTNGTKVLDTAPDATSGPLAFCDPDQGGSKFF